MIWLKLFCLDVRECWTAGLCGGKSLYEHFTGEGVASGLVANGQEFTLNGKERHQISTSFVVCCYRTGINRC